MVGSALIDSECLYCGEQYKKRADRVRDPDFCCQAHRSRHALITKAIKYGGECKACGEVYIARQYWADRGRGKYCSNKCAIWDSMIPASRTKEASIKRVASVLNSDYFKNYPTGRDHKDFKEEVIREGYLWVTGEDGTKIAAHRHAMQKHIGRTLTSDEIVHHIDRNVMNNDISNLQIMTRSEHMKEHWHEINGLQEAIDGWK